MVAVVGSLAVSLTADNDNLSRELRASGRDITQFERRANRSFSDVDRHARASFSSVGRQATALTGTLARSFAGGLIAGGIAGIVMQFGQVARSIAEIGDQAERAGVSTRVFQEWAFVAQQNRIAVDALVDGFKELNLRADEFIVTGAGPAAEAFERLGYTADDLETKLKDPSALLLEIIGRLGQLEKAAQIRISDELFGGTAGERFVELLDQGEASIRKTIDRAHELGAVMDDQLIERAAEFDRAMGAAATTVGTTLKSAIVLAADSLAEFIDGFRTFESQRTATLDNRLKELQRQDLDFENRLLALRADQRNAIPGNPFGADYGEQIRMLEQERAALQEEQRRILDVLNSREIQPMERASGTPWTPPDIPDTPPSTGAGGGSRNRSAAAAEREADAVRRLVGELEQELALVGATELEREIANVLRQAGAAATDEQRAKIVSLVAVLDAEEHAMQRATEASQELRNIGRDVLGGMISDLRAGEDAADILANALDRVADRLLDIGLDSLFNGLSIGGGSSISPLASAAIAAGTGGLFDDGGYTGPGARNESAGIVHKGEYVFSKRATDRIGVGNLEWLHKVSKGYADGGYVGNSPPIPMPGGRDNGVSIDARTTIHAPNADKEGLARLEGMIRQRDAEFPNRAVAAILEARKHNVDI